MSNHKPILNLQPINVKDGVMYFGDGTEVALFGTNYYPMSWWQYVNMKSAGADFRDAISKDVQDMKALGIQIVRVHFFESETCDAEGNIIITEHLDIFDMLVDELNQHGIYLYVTALTWWETPNARPDAFSRQISKMAMMYNSASIQASQNWIKQFFNHVNPYTKKALKDEPILAVVEIINEPWYWPISSVSGNEFEPGFLAMQTKPEVLQKDLEQWRDMYSNFLKDMDLPSDPNSYEQFHYKIQSEYLRRMIKAIKQAGVTVPIGSALFETKRNPGILRAIGDSQVDIVVDGWYPGGFDTLHEHINQMPTEAQAYKLPECVKHKAKMVYEFDICRTYNNVCMYPAYARRYRSMGAQICCQFQYDSIVTAPCNTDWGVHYLNYECTPAKAIAMKISADTFATTPRNVSYPKPTDNEIFYGTAISFENRQVLRINDGSGVFHAHSIDKWSPLKLPEIPKYIMGRGNSPYVEYEGSGLYTVEFENPDSIKLKITRNTILSQQQITNEFFDNCSLDSVKVTLNRGSKTFRLKLPGWSSYKCFDESNHENSVRQGAFLAVPGTTYYLKRSSK